MMDIEKIITERKSVRTFLPEALREGDLESLRRYLADIENPFHIPVEFRILETEGTELTSPVIVGARQYVGAKVRRTAGAEEAFGYSFERFVLYAASLGIGTVWLAATMNRSAFERAMDLSEGEVMPAVSPVGYAAKKRSLRESAMRAALKADSRLPFSELFFENSFDRPLQESAAGDFLKPLQMVRLAPSATNKQPWRVVITDTVAHFYEKKTKGYAKEETGDIQKVDVGIGLAHFELTARECGLAGSFVKEEPDLAHEEDMEYILSYRRSGR